MNHGIEKVKLSTGCEVDAFSRLRRIIYGDARPGVRKYQKAKYNRRFRRAAKAEARAEGFA